jgi:hypothetical protein
LAQLSLQQDDPVFQVAELLLHGGVAAIVCGLLLLRRGTLEQSPVGQSQQYT